MGRIRARAGFALAVVAVALGMASAPASAAQFKAGGYPATLTGSQLAAERIQTFFGGPEVICETATLSGTLAGASAEVLVHPVFGTCQAFGFLEATFTTTGCNYKVHVGALAGTDIWDGSYDVVCEAGKSIKVVAGTCELEVKSVNGINEVDLIDETGSAADMTWRPLLANIPYTVTKDGFGCRSPPRATSTTVPGSAATQSPPRPGAARPNSKSAEASQGTTGIVSPA